MNILLSFFAVLVVIFVIPIPVYAIFSAYFGVKEPEKKLNFLIGVLFQKIGTALGFVGLFYIGKEVFFDAWLAYSFLWFAMYALTEIGQTYMPNYSAKEAIAGIISEAIYFPLAGIIIVSILK